MSRPLTSRPRLRLDLDGAEMDAALAARLSCAVLRQALGAPAALELDFADPDWSDILRTGTTVRAAIDGRAVFAGAITGMREESSASGRSLRVVARDPLIRLARRQTLRALADVSAPDVAAQLAADIGLGSRSLETTPKRLLVLQHEQTDLDFLADLCGQSGLYPIVRGDLLLLMSLAGDGEAATHLELGQSLLSCDIAVAADRWLPGGVIHSRDPLSLKSRINRSSLARQDRVVDLHDPGGDPPGGERMLLNRHLGTDAEAEAMLQATLDRAAAEAAVAEGLAEGDPDLMPGRAVTIDGVLPPLAGGYVITRALHRLSATEGYVTEFSTEAPRLPRPARTPLVAVGRVTDDGDPEKLGRCRIELPDFGGLDAGWMACLSAGAGRRRGIVALPQKGDDVLVLFPEGDPGRGIVLGGLFGTHALPSEARREPHGIVLRTEGGQILDLSGGGGALKVATSGGSLLEMGPGQVRLAAAADLVIEAPRRTITIRAAEINFERE